MAKRDRAVAWVAGSLLVLSLGACGGKKDEAGAGMAGADSGATAVQDGAMGSAAGGMAATTAPTSQALGSYLQETGADATGRAFPLEQVTFDSASSTLDAADQQALGDIAAVLKQHPKAAVTITSYADPQGDAAANKKLAAARAVSVKNALAAAGLPAAQLKTNVVGETGSAPIAENRRVELLVKRG